MIGDLPDEFKSKLFLITKLLLDPFIISGFFAAFLAAVFWMIAMTKFDLSHAYPVFVGLLAIITSISAIILFNEPFGFMKVVGFSFILLGLLFLSRL